MNIKRLSILTLGIPLSTLSAYAQATGSAKEDSTLAGLFWTFVPILVLAAAAFWYLRRVQGPKEKRTEQHMERVEQSLERIARALERKDKDDA